jgi:hypothetical protein
VARQVTIKAFEVWIADGENERRVLDLIAGGLTLQKAAVAVKQPYTCLHAHFHASAENEARYAAARKAWVDFKNDELVQKVEDVVPDRDHVAKLKLEADVIASQSRAYHRERWGERVQVDKTVKLEADPALLGTASELLKIAAAKRKPVVIEGEKVVEPLPAPQS